MCKSKLYFFLIHVHMKRTIPDRTCNLLKIEILSKYKSVSK